MKGVRADAAGGPLDVAADVAAMLQVLQEDPYRLDNMDTYSNILYVKEQKTLLSFLAHQVSPTPTSSPSSHTRYSLRPNSSPSVHTRYPLLVEPLTPTFKP